VGLWVAFLFGAALGGLLGHALGRRAGARARAMNPPRIASSAVARSAPEEDVGADDVLNALNNRLAAVSALAELIPAEGLAADHTKVLATMHVELKRAADLTAHFRELAGRRGTPTEPIAFPPILDRVLKEREATIKALGVTVTRDVPEALPRVDCAPQILAEITGKLMDFSVHRLHATKPPRSLRIAASDTGPSLVVAVSDSGAPLSVTAEEQLATPFRFTQGGGGDLNFALARAMVQSVGGTLRLRARSPGAEVVMTLPRSVLTVVGPAAPRGAALPVLRILVVDDDDGHREAVTQLLRRGGHDVSGVSDGLAAMQQLKGRRDAFDVVLADLQMPQLGGRGLFEQLALEQPAMARRFVFMTGDRARPETQAFLKECGQPSVLKPYDLDELLEAMRSVAKR